MPTGSEPPPGGSRDELAAAAAEAGRRLFAQDCRFVTGAASPDGLPPAEFPEVAFAGRSNVGKSSLINALTGRRGLARTSNTPGRTQQINIFALGGRLMLVDLPGYGYARAPKAHSKAWRALVADFLRGRPTLRRVCLLIDARHGAKDSDRALMRMLDSAAVPYQAVLTKADKTRPAALEGVLEGLGAELAGHAAAHPEVAVTSAVAGSGVAELRAALAALVAPHELG